MSKKPFILRGTGFPQLDGCMVIVVEWHDEDNEVSVVPFNTKNLYPIRISNKQIQELGDNKNLKYKFSIEKYENNIVKETSNVVIEDALRNINTNSLLENITHDLSRFLRGE